MIKCPECGKEISDKAATCPNCGAPIGNVSQGTPAQPNFGQYNGPAQQPPKKKKHKGLKIFLIILVILVVLFIIAIASSNGGTDTSSIDTSKLEYITDDQIDSVYSDPGSYKGKGIKVGGRIFSEPDSSGDTVAFQMFADPENSEKNTVVYVDGGNISDYKSDEYVIVDGVINGAFTGSNALGGSVDALTINAISVTPSDYITAIAPAIKTVESGVSNSQNGVDFIVDKVEFAKNETRVYYTINNNCGANYSFYDYEMKIVVNGQQLEPQSNYYADYSGIEGEIVNGVSQQGVTAFPAMEPATFDLFVPAGMSDDYEREYQDFTLNIPVQ